MQPIITEEEQARLEKKINDGLRDEAEEKLLQNLSIDVNGVSFKADTEGLNYLGNATALANWQFNYGLSLQAEIIQANTELSDEQKAALLPIAKSFSTTYKAIYKDTKVPWVGVEGDLHTVQLETICEALQKAMLKVGSTLAEMN